tara:strand:- start:58 stop:258 length:201 start_codon:yes stop_codon:yes gene_type:complete
MGVVFLALVIDFIVSFACTLLSHNFSSIDFIEVFSYSHTKRCTNVRLLKLVVARWQNIGIEKAALC